MANVNRFIKARKGHGRSGEKLYLQVPVPKDLRAVFGRRTVERCLRTDSLALARARRDDALPEILAMFERARAEPTLDQAIAAIRRDELARAHAQWSELIFERGIAGARVALADLIEGEHAQIDDQEWLPLPSPERQHRARRMLLRNGLALTDQAIEAAATALLDAHIDGAELALEGRALAPAEPHQRATRAAAPIIPPAPRSSVLAKPVRLDEVVERYIRERQRDPASAWTEQTENQVRSTFRALLAHVGAGKPIGEVTRADVAGFLGSLAGAAPTVNRQAGIVATMFRWAQRAGAIEGDNPAAGHRRPEGKQRARSPFTLEEMQMLLSDRPETQPRQHTLRSALPWLIWLGAYSGARLNELAGLRVADVRDERGIVYLDLVDHPGRRLKTPAAARKVPVHPELMATGLAEYLEDLRGQEYLFPGLPPAGPDGKRSWLASKAFTRHRRKLGLDRPGLVFHSLRNTVATVLHNAGVPEVEAAGLLGHTVPTMSYGLYSGGLSLERLRQVVEAISYPRD